MRALVGVAGAVVVLLMLAEFFVTFLVPRRVKRGPRIARRLLLVAWQPWRAGGRRLPPRAADTALGLFGPFGLILILGAWALGLIVGFAGLHWSNDTHFTRAASGVANDLYMSAGSFFSASTGLNPTGAFARVLNILEAATGFAVFFVVIGYLPALFQAFSRREVAVSRLDPRAGSPPCGAAMAVYAAERGGWADLDGYLREWETWSAELMETHLSYPLLGYFRSQHVNQSWLAALTAVLDASAIMLSVAEEERWEGAELAFAIGRHAIADLSYAFRATGGPAGDDRLPEADFERLRQVLAEAGLPLRPPGETRERLAEARRRYEPQAAGIARSLELPLPAWLPAGPAAANWEAISGHAGPQTS
ncbi:MAG: two pore domain potassium channel family protein [Actinobacteria bacterium]|nr:MAG: two pore domain potassium channel family protein [Actinomycetota bacterium]